MPINMMKWVLTLNMRSAHLTQACFFFKYYIIIKVPLLFGKSQRKTKLEKQCKKHFGKL